MRRPLVRVHPRPNLSLRSALVVALLALLSLCAFTTSAAHAHPPFTSVVQLKVEPSGALTIVIAHDAVPVILWGSMADVGDDQPETLLTGPAEQLTAAMKTAAETVTRELILRTDTFELKPTLHSAPTLDLIRQWQAANPDFHAPCPASYIYTATLPAAARTLTIQVSSLFDDVLLAIDRPGLERSIIPLPRRTPSHAIDISMATTATPPQPSNPAPTTPAPPPPSDPSTLATAWQYTTLGFRHIIPNGPDHALLVLGLFLLTPRIRPLLLQITAFTLAHSVTLTLATLGYAHVPEWLVEPIIAASVAFIGIENLTTKKVHPWRPAVVFAFGLVHGLGFAAGLQELGLPKGQLATGIVGFSLGVELGHLAILLAAFALLGWARNKKSFRPRVVIPLSALIAAIGLWWAITRIASAAGA